MQIHGLGRGRQRKQESMLPSYHLFLQDGKSHDPLIHPPPSSDNFPKKDVISVGGCDFMREIHTLNKINSRYWKHTKRSENNRHRICAPQCFFNNQWRMLSASYLELNFFVEQLTPLFSYITSDEDVKIITLDTTKTWFLSFCLHALRSQAAATTTVLGKLSSSWQKDLWFCTVLRTIATKMAFPRAGVVLLLCCFNLASSKYHIIHLTFL